MNKTLLNKVYRGGRLMNADYHGDTWTTNTYIAERGIIEPRVYKDTLDMRDGARPKLDSIIDDPVAVELITSYSEANENNIIAVATASGVYDYNADYFNYMLLKYGLDNLLIEPITSTSKMFGHSPDGDVQAVLMGLRR